MAMRGKAAEQATVNPMLHYLKEEDKWTRTENGARTYRTTGSECLDLFAAAGALRHANDQEIWNRFVRAFAENPDLAIKIVFYARDIRGGLGERRFFRVILSRLAAYAPQTVRKNLKWVEAFGRYDDLLPLLNTQCAGEVVELISEKLKADVEAMEAGGSNISLLAKWLPSVNASNRATVSQARQLAGALGMKERQYRTTLSSLRKQIDILENHLREKDYSFDYEKVPSRASLKYRKAFYRNDEIRYADYIQRVQDNTAKMNTGTLYPYDIIAPIIDSRYQGRLSRGERASLDAMWNSQKDYTMGENALAVVDGSGSMYISTQPSPASVAMSLGIYFGERNEGPFHNHFITFSQSPRLVEIKGRDICEKVTACMSYNEVADTNIERVFQLILDTAVKHDLPQEQMPARLYIISDMEFNICARDAGVTNFENARRLYEVYGYRLPQIVFWNVASRNQQQPVQKNEQGAVLVSGCSPKIFEMATSDKCDPYEYMTEVLSGERYAMIEA